MPFGLNAAPFSFQRTIYRVQSGLNRIICLWYLDTAVTVLFTLVRHQHCDFFTTAQLIRSKCNFTAIKVTELRSHDLNFRYGVSRNFRKHMPFRICAFLTGSLFNCTTVCECAFRTINLIHTPQICSRRLPCRILTVMLLNNNKIIARQGQALPANPSHSTF